MNLGRKRGVHGGDTKFIKHFYTKKKRKEQRRGGETQFQKINPTKPKPPKPQTTNKTTTHPPNF